MNQDFINRIQTYIPDEMEAFQSSLVAPLAQSLRLNPLKSTTEFLKEHLAYLKEPSPFNKNAWIISGSYGLDPFHQAGLFYLQEPSASSVVEAMDIQPGDVVLDLCAAPGSKSTQIAGKLQDGFLVANEIMPKRAQVLLSNLERLGVEQMMVTSQNPEQLCPQFLESFDKILVDAPCSGEGMMKKHDAAREEWSLDNILLCSARQKEILRQAIPALKPGGQLMYSTCTYAKEENEQIVSWILKQYPDMEQIPVEVSFGRAGLETEGMDASLVRRIFPMDGGEGHFMARFQKKADPDSIDSDTAALFEILPDKKRQAKKAGKGKKKGKEKEAQINLSLEDLPKAVVSFLQEQMEVPFSFYMTEEKEGRIAVYGMNHPFMEKPKGSVLRQGVYIGDLIKDRFEPAWSFYLCASMKEGSKTKTEVSLEEMDAFFHGRQLTIQAPKGWRTLCYEGVPFGFGKSDGSRITNKIPKGIRLLEGSHLERKE